METRVLYYSCTSSGGLTFCSDCAVPITVLLLTVLMVSWYVSRYRSFTVLPSVLWSVNVYVPFCILIHRCIGFSPHMFLANILVVVCASFGCTCVWIIPSSWIHLWCVFRLDVYVLLFVWAYGDHRTVISSFRRHSSYLVVSLARGNSVYWLGACVSMWKWLVGWQCRTWRCISTVAHDCIIHSVIRACGFAMLLLPVHWLVCAIITALSVYQFVVLMTRSASRFTGCCLLSISVWTSQFVAVIAACSQSRYTGLCVR